MSEELALTSRQLPSNHFKGMKCCGAAQRSRWTSRLGFAFVIRPSAITVCCMTTAFSCGPIVLSPLPSCVDTFNLYHGLPFGNHFSRSAASSLDKTSKLIVSFRSKQIEAIVMRLSWRTTRVHQRLDGMTQQCCCRFEVVGARLISPLGLYHSLSNLYI